MSVIEPPKKSSSFIVFSSIAIQIIFIPISYGIFDLVASLFSPSGIGIDLFFLKNPIINYIIIFAIIIVTSIRETTKSELLASVMHVVWILFIWSETSYYFSKMPLEHLVFMLSLILTIPIRLMVQNRFEQPESST